VSLAGLTEARGFDGIVVTDQLQPFQQATPSSREWIEVVFEKPVAIGMPTGFDPTLRL
jgi:hypothetical protein